MPSEIERRQLQAYLARPEEDLLEELSLYAPSERGPGGVWDQIVGPLRQRLCVEWDYCQVRQDARFDDDLNLAVVVLGVLTGQVLHLPVTVDLPLIAAIVVKRGLDAFCGCF